MTTPAPPPPHAGGNFWDRVGETTGQLGKLAHATGTAAATPAGGYAFEPAELNAIAREWDDLARSYKSDLVEARRLAEVEGPGAEYASGDNAQMVRRSGQVLLSTLQERVDYCRAQADKFRAAAGRYAEADREAGAEIGNQGGSL